MNIVTILKTPILTASIGKKFIKIYIYLQKKFYLLRSYLAYIIRNNQGNDIFVHAPPVKAARSLSFRQLLNKISDKRHKRHQPNIKLSISLYILSLFVKSMAEMKYFSAPRWHALASFKHSTAKAISVFMRFSSSVIHLSSATSLK